MNRKKGLIIAIMSFTVNCFASQPKEIPELKKIFDQFKIERSILIYNQKTQRNKGKLK